MKSYSEYVQGYVGLLEKGKNIQLGGFDALPRPELADDAPVALIFSPHPDDECIVGALALRLLRRSKVRVINVAVTQGSNKARQADRLAELRAACDYIGFAVETTVEGGLEKINLKTREGDTDTWSKSVNVIKDIIAKYKPTIVMIPHEADSNSTHIGTHFLVMDALQLLGSKYACTVCETEFWSALACPNLMLESSADEVSALITALSFHAEEVKRNPYHLRLPAWMEDNVRRGGELVGGQGGAAPDFAFATLYRISRWSGEELVPAYEDGKILGAGECVLTAINAD